MSAASCASRSIAALPDGRTIRIYFERRSRTERSRRPISTVLSIEGGPGFSTTADRSARIQLWRPLSARRDLLLVDLRGTGRSGPLDCPAFRRHILGYIDRAARCAAELGPGARRLRHLAVGAGSGRGAPRARHRRASTSTAIPTAHMRPRRSRSATRRSCGRSCSTAPTSCRAPIRRWPTSPRARGARSAWRAAAAPDARPAGRSRRGSCSAWSRASAAIRSSAPRPTGTARPPMCASTRTRSSRS